MKQKSLEEVIIKENNKFKTAAYGNIYSGVYIKEILYEFNEVKLFEDRATIMLPIVFKEMPEWAAKLKYPSCNRPQIIMTNYDGSINCCFSMLEQELNKDEIDVVANEIKVALKKLHLAEEFLLERIETTSSNIYSWFTYTNGSMNGKLFNHMFITLISGKMFQGMFNCPYRDMNLWKYIMKDMMLTMKDTKLLSESD